jgi:hypothetical protein
VQKVFNYLNKFFTSDIAKNNYKIGVLLMENYKVVTFETVHLEYLNLDRSSLSPEQKITKRATYLTIRQHLLIKILRLALLGYLHLDLHRNNILVNTANNTCFIIDYGRCINIKDEYDRYSWNKIIGYISEKSDIEGVKQFLKSDSNTTSVDGKIFLSKNLHNAIGSLFIQLIVLDKEIKIMFKGFDKPKLVFKIETLFQSILENIRIIDLFMNVLLYRGVESNMNSYLRYNEGFLDIRLYEFSEKLVIHSQDMVIRDSIISPEKIYRIPSREEKSIITVNASELLLQIKEKKSQEVEGESKREALSEKAPVTTNRSTTFKFRKEAIPFDMNEGSKQPPPMQPIAEEYSDEDDFVPSLKMPVLRRESILTRKKVMTKSPFTITIPTSTMNTNGGKTIKKKRTRNAKLILKNRRSLKNRRRSLKNRKKGIKA